MDLIFRNVRIDDTKPLMDVAVHNGKIIEVAPTISAQAKQEIQGHGKVLIPGFVEGHLHLEKANIMHRKANRSGTLKEAIAVTAQLKPTLTRDDIFERSTHCPVFNGLIFFNSKTIHQRGNSITTKNTH